MRAFSLLFVVLMVADLGLKVNSEDPSASEPEKPPSSEPEVPPSSAPEEPPPPVAEEGVASLSENDNCARKWALIPNSKFINSRKW